MANVSFLEYMNAASPNIAGIVQIITNASFALRRLRFVQVPMFTYEYGRQQTTGGISFRGFNEYYTSDAGVLSPAVEILKIFGGSIRTDRQLARGPKGNAVRANNIYQKVKRAGLNFDLNFLKGNSSTNPRATDGLNRRLVNNQVISLGGPLTLPAIDNILDATIGTNDQKVLIMNKACRRQLKKLIIDAAGGAAVADINAPTASYGGAQIEVVDEDGDDNPILTFNESQDGTVAPPSFIPSLATPSSPLVASTPGGAFTSLYCINPSGDADDENLRGLVREVDGTMIEQVAYGERSGFFEDLVEAVMGIALHHPRCAARLCGITTEDITQETAAAA